MYYFKGTVPIPPLGMVDDLFTISVCGYKTNLMNKFINTKTAMKKLQFGTSKCVKMHVGKTCNPTLCHDLFVNGWNVQVVGDDETGKCSPNEFFSGPVKMGEVTEQMYLGDIISADGSHSKNVEARKNKGLGIINNIMQILKFMFFGKYYFEVALIMRSTLLLSSLLLNSEAWVNMYDSNIRSLEQTDEILLSKVLGSEANTSNIFKYLELGVYPVRFDIMKRKVLFLQYILKQEKESMMYKVFQATLDHPSKNDFVTTCLKYLKCLNITLSLDEISELSEYRFKHIVKEKTRAAAFKYLMEQKNLPGKNTKIKNIHYNSLCIQEYLLDGNENSDIAKVIFKARGKNLEIKEHKKWKFSDNICVGCDVNFESEAELLACPGLAEQGHPDEKLSFKSLFGKNTSEMYKVGREIRKRLKCRERIIEQNKPS